MHAYPMLFEAMVKEKVWGGRRLGALGKPLPEGAMIGESWEIADLGETHKEGGGGGSASSTIANGEMRGLTLRDAVRAMGGNLMGSAGLSGEGGFPLLVKYLDARENLSVQVHPSPAYARAHPGAHLKTESWYIVEAEPGAKIYTGVKVGVDPATFESKARARDASIVEDLVAVEVAKGDFVHLPSGTCHALGAGVLVAEVQVSSDTTFRVFDWGRTDRTVHIEESMACIAFGEAAEVIRAGTASRELAENEFYAVREMRVGQGERIDLSGAWDGPRVWMVIEGGCDIASADDLFERVRVERGRTVLLPAGVGAAMASFDSAAVVLETEVRGGA